MLAVFKSQEGKNKGTWGVVPICSRATDDDEGFVRRGDRVGM
jgi:hypothetical protein